MATIGFISLGCAKNQVDCERMMFRVQEAGHTVNEGVAGSDVVVINTCGFIDSAKSEAIDYILQTAALKAEGQVGKILVTGCLSQRYQGDILQEMPEVDGVLGTGSYTKIVPAIEQLLSGHKVVDFGSIDAPEEEVGRMVTTPEHFSYLKIAEGCNNRCAFCIIPYLRGKYRSRRMEDILAEARQLADAGVKELIIIAQDITRYGTDLYGEHKLAALLRELCKLDFHWIRLHYLYPEEITPELIDTIAQEPKILKYIDLPIQHCNDQILRTMCRRSTKDELLELFSTLRERIPGLVLRTSLITGLPYEDEAAFEELCQFLQDVRIERAGVFPYSPEEGTPAAKMLNRVDADEAQRRADLIVDVQSRIMDDFNESRMGDVTEVLCDGWDEQSQSFVGRSYAESPDIDGRIYFSAERDVQPGEFVPVRITGAMDGELTGELAEEE